MRTTAQVRSLDRVVVEMVQGDQVHLDPDEPIWTEGGRAVDPLEVPEVLADARRWIEYDSQVRWEPAEIEPWRGERSSAWHRSTRRVYARGVAEVNLVWAEVVEQ